MDQVKFRLLIQEESIKQFTGEIERPSRIDPRLGPKYIVVARIKETQKLTLQGMNKNEENIAIEENLKLLVANGNVLDFRKY